jgi:hypothetical protein
MFFVGVIAQQVLKTKNRSGHQIGFVFGSVLGSLPLRVAHIRGRPRSTVAAPGPVGGTDFLKVSSFLMRGRM